MATVVAEEEKVVYNTKLEEAVVVDQTQTGEVKLKLQVDQLREVVLL